MNARHMGSTTRLVDEAIQRLFILGRVSFGSKMWDSRGVDERELMILPIEDIPNEVIYKMFLDRIIGRLEFEHRLKTIKGLQDSSIVICNYLEHTHTLLFRGYEPYTKREKATVLQEIQHYTNLSHVIQHGLSKRAEFFK